MALIACKDKKTPTAPAEEKEGFDYTAFASGFASIRLPYQLADTMLLKMPDTAALNVADIKPFIADSITNQIFGKGAKPKYFAIGKTEVPKEETYFLVKAISSGRKAVLLLCFDKAKQYGATLPFLVIDADPATIQTSTIDKNYTISRNIIRKQTNGVIKEGKDVYVYNDAAKQYTLIMTDPLDEKNMVLVNPIDTLPHKTKFAGDYVQNKNNIVSVRDGRRPNEIRVFVHFEKDSGECTGELKGDALYVSASQAVYRQGGDPCVLEFNFTPSSVTIREQEGCGSHRGLRCLFEGTYPRKKEPKAKIITKKPAHKKK